MELSKTNAARLLVFAVVTLVLCVVAIGLLGLSLEKYWRYYFRVDAETARLQAVQIEVTRLEGILSERRRDVATIPGKWDEYSALTNSLQTATERSAALTAEEKALRKELETGRAALADCESRLAVTNALLSERSQILAQNEAHVRDLIKTKCELEGVDALIVRSRQVLTNLEVEVDVLQDKREKLESKIKTLKISEDDLRASVQTERDRLSNLKTEYASTARAFAVTNSMIGSFSEQLVSAKRKIAEAQAQQKELEGLGGEISARKKELELADASLTAAKAKQEAADAQLLSAQQKLNDARVALSGAEEKCKSEKRILETLNADVAAVEARKVKLSAELLEVEKSYGVKSQMEKQLVDRLATLAGEYIAVTSGLAIVRERVRTEVREAQADLDTQLAVKEENAAKRIERAAATQKAAEEKAAKIIKDAKEAAAAVEASAASDKIAAETARKARLEDELKLKAAQQEEKALQSRIIELRKEVENLAKRVEPLRGCSRTNQTSRVSE